MVIERFRIQNANEVYRRFSGRCVEASLNRCFQLMECDDVTLLQKWVAQWSDLMAFEIAPVVPGKETSAALAPDTQPVQNS
jgi:hypothetical protein